MERVQASEIPRSGRFAFAARRLLQIAAALGCFAPSLSQALESDCADGVCIDVERTETGASFHARNQTAAPVSLLLEFPVLENMTSSQTLPVKAVVLPNERKLLAQIRADARADSIRSAGNGSGDGPQEFSAPSTRRVRGTGFRGRQTSNSKLAKRREARLPITASGTSHSTSGCPRAHPSARLAKAPWYAQ